MSRRAPEATVHEAAAPPSGRLTPASRADGRRAAEPRGPAPEPKPRAPGAVLLFAIALAAVGVFLALGAAVGWPGGTPAAEVVPRGLAADRFAAGLAGSLYQPEVVGAIKILTDLGSLPITALVVSFTAYRVWTRGRGGDGLPLVVGLALTYPLVHLAKAAWARPRPLDPHKVADGFAYPSGHAAYAVAFVAGALVLAQGRPAAHRAALLAGGCLLAAGVAASRVYLRAHYLTDVLGGMALAGAMFAVAYGVWRVRHNRLRVRP